MYTEALSVAEYAESEEIYVPTNLLEKLYANRAAAYLNIVPVSRGGALAVCPVVAVQVDFRACIEHLITRSPSSLDVSAGQGPANHQKLIVLLVYCL